MSAQERTALLHAARGFCDAFSAAAPPDEILGHFSRADADVLVLEHGLPQLAPFLGRAFRGREGVRAYLDLLAGCLRYENMRFGNFIVDAEERKVSVRGGARFTWAETGQSWDEVFTYVLAFDDDAKVKSYEIWADSGAAYLASRGLLR